MSEIAAAVLAFLIHTYQDIQHHVPTQGAATSPAPQSDGREVCAYVHEAYMKAFCE